MLPEQPSWDDQEISKYKNTVELYEGFPGVGPISSVFAKVPVFSSGISMDRIGVVSVLTVRMSTASGLRDWKAAFDQIKKVLDNHSNGKSGKYSHLVFDNLNVPKEFENELRAYFAKRFGSYQLLLNGVSNVLILISEEEQTHSAVGTLLIGAARSPGCLIVRFQCDGVISKESSDLSSLITSFTPYNQLIDPEYNKEIRKFMWRSDSVPPPTPSSIQSHTDRDSNSRLTEVVL